MGLESTTSISGLVPTNPAGADSKSEGDDHIRLLKSVLQATFPGLSGRFNRIQGKTSSYGIVLADAHSLILVSAGSSITISTAVSAATLGNGFSVVIYNLTSLAITFDPFASEVINGSTLSQSIPPQHFCFVWSDGVQFFIMTVPATPPQVIPAGVVAPTATSFAPSGWLFCDGATLDRTTYAALYAAIGGAFGEPSGTTFLIPDLRGRTVFGIDPGFGLVDGNSSFSGHIMGFRGGSQYTQSHQHFGSTGTESVDHTHSFTDNYHDGAPSAPSLATQGGGGYGADPTGHPTETGGRTAAHTHDFSTTFFGNGGFQNMPPAMMLNWIIKT